MTRYDTKAKNEAVAESSTKDAQSSRSDVELQRHFSECLFSQYTGTVTGIATGTAYALAKKPKSGLGIMLIAGGVGTVADGLYGWFVACQQERQDWQKKRASN